MGFLLEKDIGSLASVNSYLNFSVPSGPFPPLMDRSLQVGEDADYSGQGADWAGRLTGGAYGRYKHGRGTGVAG